MQPEHLMQAGYTRKVVLDCAMTTLFLLVKSDTDLGDRFKAYDTDAEEFIIVNGWLFTFEDGGVS